MHKGKLLVYLMLAVFIVVTCRAAVAESPGCGRLDTLLWRGEYREAARVLCDSDCTGPSKNAGAGLPATGFALIDAAKSDVIPFLYSRLGRYSRALSSMARDSMAVGLFRFSKGEYGTASRYLSTRQSNPYREVYRRYHLARALAGDSLLERAFTVISGVFRDDAQRRILRELPIYGSAVELMVGLALEGGRGDIDQLMVLMEGDLVTPKVHLLLSRGFKLCGRIDRAKRELMSALEMPVDTSAYQLYRECIEGLIERRGVFNVDELVEVAAASIRLRMLDTAEMLMELLSKDLQARYRLRFLRGEFRAAKGRLKEARSTFRKLFNSDAPVEIKKDALWRLATIDYSLADYAKSASNYRKFAFYYPRDSRSTKALDRAARIYIRLGRNNSAAELLREIRKRVPGTRAAHEAGLAEAAIYLYQGRKSRAAKVLGEIDGISDWLCGPAILYWKYRLEGDTETKEVIGKRLKGFYPLSVYRFAIERRSCNGGFQASVAREDSIFLLELEGSERSLFQKLVDAKGAMDAGDDRLTIIRTLIRAGMLEEGAEIARSFIRQYSNDERFLLSIYFYARSIGMVHVSLKAFSALLDGIKGYEDFRTLKYPVCFVDYIDSSSRRWNVPRLMLLAVMREESSFDPQAESSAGAVGLMQIMPGTANWIFSRLRMKVETEEALRDPALSISGGAWYLSRLLRLSHGSVAGAAALYNAGEGKMKAWMNRAKPWKHELLSMELIGPRETRNFARRVINSLSIYHYIAECDSDI